ncbi:serpin B3-like protein [Leptotrombidium deliense]|uniref:Serpin B3-like protein n=1 Tax=Leptotrombidium deliense TaxID=299467 RepID=A0A443SNW2_9ACAR|nr:serpin B3-like protein [Leptotrombidium deliense]
MKRVQILLVAFVAVCLLAIIVIAFLVSKPDPKSYKYPVDALSDAINKFSFDFYNAVGDSKRDTNFVYSPLSVASAFGILLLGSRTKTERAIFDAFSFNLSVAKPTKVRDAFEPLLDSFEDVSNYSMFLANKLILQQYFDVKSSFKREAKQKYKCVIDAFDFTRNPQKLIEKVNKWVSEKTKGKIDKLFTEPLSSETKMVILNAVYFHAKWLHIFNKSETVKNPFFNKLGEVQQVDFMKIRQHFMLYNHTEKGFTLLELKYNGNVSFNVIFPNKFENDGLPNVMRNLTIDDVQVAFNRSTKQEVNLLMPKDLQ